MSEQDDPLQRAVYRAYAVLRSALRRGSLSPTERIDEQRLVKDLHSTRTAVRGALKQLTIDGLVVRAPRRGTQVSRSLRQVSLDGLRTVHNLDLEVQRLDIRSVPLSSYLADVLDSDPGREVLLVERLLGNGASRCLETMYLAVEGDEGLERFHEVFQRRGNASDTDNTLSRYFRRIYFRSLGRVELTIEAVACAEDLAELLEISPGDPVFFVQRVLIDDAERASEVSFGFFPAAFCYLS